MFFPIFIDLTGKEILVVGAGAVAGRRIRVLLGFGARITVVAPEIGAELVRIVEAQCTDPGTAAPDAEAVKTQAPDPTAAASGSAAGSASLDVTFCRRKFLPSDLDGKQMVLAATDDGALNRRIAELCRARGIPVNDCSDRENCDFQFPSVVLSGDVVIGINASGKDHSLVREARRRVEQALGVADGSSLYR